MHNAIDDKHRDGATHRLAARSTVQSLVQARATRGAIALALTVAALGGCGGSGAPSGAYTTHIAPIAGKNGGFIAGDWTVTFKKGGSYTIATNHPTVTLGVGKGSHFQGTTFVINPVVPGSCGPGPDTGTYTMKFAGSAVRFLPVSDPCRIRAFILGRTFTKR
jgi:hypothetical protein